ncbi:ergosterol biosynthesis protein-like protein [Trematosphaeria pertusa]|uniref:Ergosterol biosynthesis protein-like protein n=1 Tax=Trematosphaeria pertusa TaxID=390896 RepID=A0A6A6HYI4_9PLEO|nr:ergosterol biosynthesis protein-like protein [Trematosphaeria pertusa]KAF2242420.1 ergosterol biosynthesis protein-like protein [Trematosphaeria pertusa]
MATDLASYLPPFEGLLPKWLLLVSMISIANSIQAYTTLHYTARVYNPNPDTSQPPSNIRSSSPSAKPPSAKPPSADSSTSKTPPADAITAPEIPSQVTPLSARKFGTWTFLTAIVRLYAAYHITDKAVYELGMWTYGIAWAHFMSEWWVFGTTRWGAPLAGPVFVSTGSLVWMWVQREFYLGQ